MQLTNRDIEIINFINEFGYCEMPHIEKRFGLKKPRSYKVIRRLLLAELVKHQRIFHSTYGVYYLTAQGAEFTELPPLGKISVGRCAHQRILTDVYIKLLKKYTDGNWISERRLKHDKFYAGLGKRGHVSDGILILPDNKQIAIEVELSMKGKDRIDRILRAYSSQLSINEVWYYCPARMVPALSALVSKKSFVKVFNLTEFLG